MILFIPDNFPAIPPIKSPVMSHVCNISGLSDLINFIKDKNLKIEKNFI